MDDIRLILEWVRNRFLRIHPILVLLIGLFLLSWLILGILPALFFWILLIILFLHYWV